MFCKLTLILSHRTTDLMDSICGPLSKMYTKLQAVADEMKEKKLILEDKHKDLTKSYEEQKREEAKLLLTGR